VPDKDAGRLDPPYPPEFQPRGAGAAPVPPGIRMKIGHAPITERRIAGTLVA
jgi:hypothetical protein